MGACSSTAQREAAAKRKRSEAIDREIEEESPQFKKICNLLLLGLAESGKSTIIKQMKIIHQNGYTKEELLTFRPVIFRNLVDSSQDIVRAMRNLCIDPTLPENRQNADNMGAQTAVGALLGLEDDTSEASSSELRERPGANHSKYPAREINGMKTTIPQFSLDPEIAQAIHALWADPCISELMDHSSEFYLMDSAAYFFGEVLRIGSPDYVPSEMDVLRARAKSSGISETRFKMGELSIHMFDVGGLQSERRKWIHYFEAVNCIIYCVALSEYNHELLEATGQNWMLESLAIFESIINSRRFARTSIILFLNKVDIFKAKITKVALEKYFTDYTGVPDVNEAAKYILWRCMQLNRARLAIYPHMTQATDTGNIQLVFGAIKETILSNALRGSGIL